MSKERPTSSLATDAKQAEIDYPETVTAAHRRWLETKPFRGERRHTVRHLIDVGYVTDLLELEPGVRYCELGCGSGWMTRYAARVGAEATGYDISPAMIEIARAQAAAGGVEATFVVADMEQLETEARYDRCLIYEALHHSSEPAQVLAAAHSLLVTGGVLLLAEPNWTQRFAGRKAAQEHGTTERGYSSRHLKQLVRQAGFAHVERFHSNRRRLYSNRPMDVVRHLTEPVSFRVAAPFRAQIWLRARAA